VPTSTLIRGADVLDIRAGTVGPADILIEGALVAAVEPGGIQPDARVIDATGTTVIPGLIDCHVHVDTAAMIATPLLPESLAAAIAGHELRGMLLRGFTTVRDVAGADGGHREAVERGLFPGPRLYVCCDALTQTGGHGDSRGPGDRRLQDRPGSVVVDGAD
jgi:imidazolonepropionase-like amidohydrolase